MAEDLSLPASLQRLEIAPERAESEFNDSNPFSIVSVTEDQPECFLENLSLKAICSNGNCLCNKKKEQKEEDEVLKKLKRTQRRAVLRKSRLSSSLLRAPVLKLNDIKQTSSANCSSAFTAGALDMSMPGYISIYPFSTPRGDGAENKYKNKTRSISPVSGKSLLRAPILKVEPQRSTPHLQHRSSEETSTHRPLSMCAVQARNPAPDDTNIEELASYFDLLVHIPKKMSVMAEMMYI